jgi:hypothetical protein
MVFKKGILKHAFQKYLNLISYNSQNYGITPFFWWFFYVYIQFRIQTRIWIQNLELTVRIRIQKKFLILKDPDPNNCKFQVFTFLFIYKILPVGDP